ncbi:MAG: hypothetical protein ACKER6_01130 [Candidatus Hodgkinia cicadicola]
MFKVRIHTNAKQTTSPLVRFMSLMMRLLMVRWLVNGASRRSNGPFGR